MFATLTYAVSAKLLSVVALVDAVIVISSTFGVIVILAQAVTVRNLKFCPDLSLKTSAPVPVLRPPVISPVPRAVVARKISSASEVILIPYPAITLLNL